MTPVGITAEEHVGVQSSALPPRASAVKVLSADARRLLDYLYRNAAHAPARAIKHAIIAEALRIHERHIVDLARECLEAHHLVCATTSHPHGCFVLRPGDPIEPARHYLATLRSRALGNMRRRRALRLAIEHRERNATPADSTGQHNLFAQGVQA